MKKLTARFLVGAILLATGATAGSAQELAVKVENQSKPVRCAEEDNVTLMLASPEVRRFRIEAVHPTYLASLRSDNWDPDWTACDFGPGVEKSTGTASQPATPPKKPERFTLYEDTERWLVGLKDPNFWREATATVRVGDRITKGLHLLQLWRVRPNGGEEVLVIYPQDGYWRARPKAPKGRDLTAYGSSFLIGPIEQAGRPIVRLGEVRYDPALEGFDLTFVAGGTARVKLAEISAARLALDVTFAGGSHDKPFAAIRSMYITGTNNDVANAAVRGPGSAGWQEAGIMAFKGADKAVELWAGRHSLSQHNTSSPDMLFKWFRK